MLEQEKRQTEAEELGQLFHVFDADNKGYISAERLQRTLADMGEQVTLAEAQAMVRYADPDGDSKVSREDFLKVFHHHK
jgi:Ca2+-binding EF-hand superfamily protein